MALWAILGTWWLAAAHAANVDLTWNLTADGSPAGQQTLQVHELEGEVRVLESYTEVTALGRPPGPTTAARFLPWHWPVFRKRTLLPVYRHRITVTEGAGPAAFHSVVQVAGEPSTEVQGRPLGGVWRLTVTEGGTTRPVAAPDVTYTTLDLLDPRSPWRAEGGGPGRMLDVRTGELSRGTLVKIGPATVPMSEGAVSAELWEWRGDGDTWRLYYAEGGVLVRYERELAGRAVQADLVGGAPVLTDEFVVPAIQAIEVTSG